MNPPHHINAATTATTASCQLPVRSVKQAARPANMFFALLFPKACRHQHQAAGQEAHPVGNSKNDHAKHGPEEHNVALHARPREHDDCHKRRQASVDHRRPLVCKCGPNTFCFAQRCALLAEGFRNVGWIFKIKKRVQSRHHKHGEAAEWN